MPGVGPILLFDKSALQSLSVDEAVWLDTFYYPVITPLFFVETLADLEKEVDGPQAAFRPCLRRQVRPTRTGFVQVSLSRSYPDYATGRPLWTR